MRVNPVLAYQHQQCRDFESKLLRLREEAPLRDMSLEETKQPSRSLLSSPRAQEGRM